MYFDSDVTVSCEDLTFTYSVWRSSYDSAVGYFPRFVENQSQKRIFHGPSYVAWNKKYSLLLSSALMMKKSYIEVF